MTRQSRLLIVDNDARYREWLRHHLGALFPDAAISAIDIGEFESWCEMLGGRECDVLLLGAAFGDSPEDPASQGLHLLRQLRKRAVFPAVITLAEQGNELTTVRALQLGAMDYLPKRLLTPERLRTSIRLVLRRLEKRGSRAKGSPEPAAVQDAAAPAAPSPAPSDSEASVASTPDVSPSSAGACGEAGARAEPGPADTDTVPKALPSLGGGAPLSEPVPSDLIPGYHILLTIGESEKAAVYLAVSSKLGHNVALKVSKSLRDEAAGRQFLEREYTAIAALRNPSVVRLYDYGVHGGFEYLAMEYLPHGDLKARIQQGVSEMQAVRYIDQIAAALQVVHEAGLLHRDLKPPNVMLRENDAVALIDFGLARALDGSAHNTTRTGVLRGSPYYMSPEQALGEQLDARSDFYGLGVIFYEMLTGRRPFTGNSAMEVLQQHVNAPVPRLPRTLARYEPVLTRLLAKSRHDRFASALELRAALAELREPLAAQSTAA